MSDNKPEPETIPLIQSDGVIPARVKWFYETGGRVKATPLVGIDGIAYCGSMDNYLYALGPQGQLLWKFATKGEIHATPGVGEDGTIYIGSADKNV